ncbi:MAG: ATP-dependent Clp protease proteolytic subunit [Clostridiales bacterium]|nr:ATP-dependent Clp protease proteolytic subunit [Clostridiales bacterium]
MKRFFNVIPSKGECCILLYGDIGDYDLVKSANIAQELLEAEAQYQKINVHINSNGGDVFSGIAIFNALRNSQADITIYVDGIAASIASIVALCGKPVYMSRYARLMLHGVSGGVYGTKTDLKDYLEQMEALETTLCEMYAAKLQQSPEEIKARYFDGQDHWLTAEEAHTLGLIDGIYDAAPVPEADTPEKVYQYIQNKYNQSLKENKMLEQLKKRASFANCATDDQVLQKIDELENTAAKVPGLEQEKTTLQAEVDGYKEKEKQAQEAAYDQEVDTAFDEGRITDPERTEFKNLMRVNPESVRNIIQTRPAKRRAINNIHQPSTGDKKSPWDRRMEEIENNLKK